MELLDYRRRIADVYARARAATNPRDARNDWRKTRDELFATHSQSPLPEERRFGHRGLHYYPYDLDARVQADVEVAERSEIELPTSTGPAMTLTRFGRATFTLGGEALALDLFWVGGYGGGLFLPFADATNGSETHGAGRYLFDTVKGADLGSHGDRLVLDFNFAYHPSCAYDERWACPLAAPGNRLGVPVPFGERLAD